jgi:hypothetical protein
MKPDRHQFRSGFLSENRGVQAIFGVIGLEFGKWVVEGPE